MLKDYKAIRAVVDVTAKWVRKDIRDDVVTMVMMDPREMRVPKVFKDVTDAKAKMDGMARTVRMVPKAPKVCKACKDRKARKDDSASLVSTALPDWLGSRVPTAPRPDQAKPVPRVGMVPKVPRVRWARRVTRDVPVARVTKAIKERADPTVSRDRKVSRAMTAAVSGRRDVPVSMAWTVPTAFRACKAPRVPKVARPWTVPKARLEEDQLR